MKYIIKPPLERTLDRAKKRRVRIGVMVLLSAIVTVITFNRLTFRADTLERFAACGLAEHTHTEACYDETGTLICGMEEHIHTDACYQARPVEVSTDDFLEIELECEDIEEPALELDELSLGELDAEIIAETPIPEFVPVAEAPDYQFIIGEQCPVYLGAILDAVGLAVDDPVEVGQVIDEEHPEGMIWFEQDEHGLAIYPAHSFEQIELAVFTEDDIIIVNLLNAVVPEATPTSQTTEESSIIEDTIAPQETPKSDVTTEPEETSVYNAAIEAEETPKPETIIELEDTLEPEASAEPENTPEPEAYTEPEDSPVPESSVAPVDTPEPEEPVEPEDMPEPEETAESEDSPVPEETAEPEDTPVPEEIAEPEDTPEPEETAEPEDTTEPEETVEPEDSPEPEASAEPEDTPEPEESAEPEDATEEEPIVPSNLEVVINVASLEGPFSLSGWMTQARPIDASEKDAVEETVDTPSAEEWLLDYDIELLSIEYVSGDYTVMPMNDFDETTILVDTVEAFYRITLLNRQEEQSDPEFLIGTFVTAVDGADYVLRITVPEAANLPSTATFKAIAVEDGIYESTALDYFPNDSERSLLAMFDLTILVDGQAVQPKAALGVCVDFGAALPGNIQVAAVHFPEHESEDAIPTRKLLMTSAVNPETEVIEARIDETGVSFRATSFSVYAVVCKTLETVLRASDQRNYWIEVAYDEAANIPDGAQLSVSEVPEEGEEYAEGVDRMARALSDANSLAFVSGARLFNIDILYEGERIEPDAPVLVTVRYADPVPLEDDAVFEIVHLPEGDAEVLPIEKMESDTFSFETGSFSTFAFGQANYIGSLNGQSFAIVRDNGKDKVALLSEAENGTMLKGTYVNVLEEGLLTAVTAANGKVESDMPITVWTFEHVRDNLYFIRSDDGQYMNLTTGSLTVGDTPGLIEVYPIDSSGNLSGYLRLRCADDTAYVISNRWGSAAGGFQTAKSTDGNTRFALYASVDNAVYPEFTAQKRNASELEGGKSYVIYQRVYNEELGEYEDYVVAGDGSLVYAFDDGDYVGYRTDKSTTWYLYEYKDDDGNPTGYYDFYNPATGNYLAPQAGGILSKSPLGLLMDVSGANTTIEAWDDASKKYVELSCDIVGRALTPCESGDSALFSFAEAVEFETGVLHPVETVDSVAAGIRISMYDFSSRASMNLFNDDTWYKNGAFKQGLLKPILGVDGWPISCTGRSFSAIYNSANYRGDANHLFLKSVYDATGYYEYNAFNNFAHYDAASGDFTVYQETGIPQNGAGGAVSSYYRGNFLPYNNLDVSKPGTNTHLYDTLFGWVSLENPMLRDTMYLMKEKTIDYQFGTVIEASFLQARDGLDANGAPVVYEFMGDDDLWVYIDGVLVLDIGGVHSSVSGYIDFSTGVVDAGGVKTTLRQAFKDAGIFPDGTTWNDNLADEYFQGDTFRDYSGHTMKMFYQERGSGASTLKVRFNLPVVESGTFAVEKQLSGTDQAGYANVQFAYQAFAVIDGQNVPLYPGVEISSSPVAVNYEGGGAMDFHDGVLIGDKAYDHVFYLKPGEACVFSGIPEDVPYFVQEIDVSGAYYDTVMINEADMGGDGGIPEDEAITAVSSAKTIVQRQRVQFVNRCSPANLKDLRITKRVENPIDEQATFEFRVMLEGADGALTNYSRGKYYMVKGIEGQEHYFTYVDGVLTDQGTQPVVCSESGQYGTIAGIPDGYTVVIKGLLAGTDFLVEEIRNPTGYAFVSKELEDGSCDPAEVPGADGQIKLREDARMTVTNHCLSSITVNKVWESGEYVAVHGPVTMALYRKEGDTETLATRGAVLKSDPVQTIEAPSVNAVWLLELPANDSLDNYVVREVVVEGDLVTPVFDGDTVVMPGETPGNTYVVSYAQGDVQTLSGDDPYIQRRTDTVTNTRKQRLSFMKVDIANTEQPLSGAVFDLFRVNDGERVEPAFLSGMISGDNGLLSYDGETVFELEPGPYQLVETTAPRGYNLKSAPITITIMANAVNYDEGSSLSSDGSGKKVDSETDVITLLISNTAGITLPATGGSGISFFYSMGSVLIVLAIYGLYLQIKVRAKW